MVCQRFFSVEMFAFKISQSVFSPVNNETTGLSLLPITGPFHDFVFLASLTPPPGVSSFNQTNTRTDP